MYDSSGKSIWYATQGTLASDTLFTGTLTLYGNGQSLGGAFAPARVTNGNVGALTVRLSTPTAGTLTLPGGTQIPIQRYQF
jgi:hypothetical protein